MQKILKSYLRPQEVTIVKSQWAEVNCLRNLSAISNEMEENLRAQYPAGTFFINKASNPVLMLHFSVWVLAFLSLIVSGTDDKGPKKVSRSCFCTLLYVFCKLGNSLSNTRQELHLEVSSKCSFSKNHNHIKTINCGQNQLKRNLSNNIPLYCTLQT